MNQRQSTFTKIYFGAPRFVGAVFQATKIPSIIILLYLIGLPILLTILSATRIIPVAAIQIGIYQLQSPANRAHTPAAILQEMASMTPEQLDTCRTVAKAVFISAFIAVLAFVSWMVLFLRFVVRRMMRRSNHRV